MSDELQPKLFNVVALAGSLGKLVDLMNKINNTATLALLEADVKMAADDVQALMAAVDKASADLEKTLSDLRSALGV
jgi:multidrug resistance efflux pump